MRRFGDLNYLRRSLGARLWLVFGVVWRSLSFAVDVSDVALVPYPQDWALRRLLLRLPMLQSECNRGRRTSIAFDSLNLSRCMARRTLDEQPFVGVPWANVKDVHGGFHLECLGR